MLNIDIVFIKGIFFLRLEGKITKDNYLKERRRLLDIIISNGIRYCVINLCKVTELDGYGKDTIKDIFEYINNNGTVYISNSVFSFNKTIKMIDNEYKALKIITI